MKTRRRFHPEAPEGKEFMRRWNAASRDGIQKELARYFGISVATVCKLRKWLGLPALHSKKHPGRRKLVKRIKRLYLNKERSTLQIAKMLNMSDEQIRSILRQENVELRPQNTVNARYFPTRCTSMTHHQLLTKIKRLYEEKHLSATSIAKKLGIDQGTVCTKLRTMNISLRQNHKRVLKGDYRCQWCATVMERVYQNSGPKKQKYCSISCKNRAKDYRKLVRGRIVNIQRKRDKERFLKEAWGKEYHSARNAILSAEPCIINSPANTTDPLRPTDSTIEE